jgi:hypothetical protein
MANVITGRVWTLDTAVGIVTRDPINIYGIMVTWKVASAGAIVLAEVNEPGEGAVGETILDAVSLGASSAAVDQMSQWFPIQGWFQGLRKVTMTDISKIAIYVK